MILKNKFNLSFNDTHISTNDISILGVLFFYVWMSLYAVFIFQQFNWQNILAVSLAFLIILGLLVKIFIGIFSSSKIHINIYTISSALILSYFMIMIANAPNTFFLDYYHTFPLLETEVGLGWHRDSAFHVSIIQSILNFGYPSTGQHGTPVLFYHTLSHYVDALLVYITGVEPYDSYGLFYHFKTFLLIASIVIFLGRVFRNVRAISFLLIFLLGAPVIIGSWHAIASHGLWFTSVLLILSSIKIFVLLVQNEHNDLADIVFCFFLVVVLALGKISTGFMCAVFIGSYLLIKKPKNYLVYLLGICWVIFFYSYQSLMSSSQGGLSPSNIEPLSIYRYLTTIYLNNARAAQTNLYYSFGILCALGCIFRNKKNYIAIAATVCSYFIFSFLVIIKTDLNSNDIYYFQYGLFSILILFVIQSLELNIGKYENEYRKTPSHCITSKIIILVSVTLSIILSGKFYLPDYSIINMGYNKTVERLSYLKNGPFIEINKISAPNKTIYFGKDIRDQLENFYKRPLKTFRNRLKLFLAIQSVSQEDALLFISKEIFIDDLAQFGGISNYRGMLIYAVTGVPLVNGVENFQIKRYGFDDYSEDSLWVKNDNFHPEEICVTHPSKSVVSVDNFDEATFSIYHCGSSK